ncbi:hypothetical protein [Paenibacillus sp. 481]|uniref:hypothetical protein n=1 Tax=Paenibacillus sp. 481 TaxID=2835869 RepID=UPI001E4001B8|nr:hypothetical protein [Paenibacillus sp. 481]UHA73104.1 hypothetical protein KIK04_21300 [Paenibacillus sp. 481]
MKTTIFIGSCDKSDHLLAIATILSRLGRKVLLVDATTSQWMSYRIGKWAEKIKIVSWSGFDVAVNIMNWEELEERTACSGESVFMYDDVIVDTDRVVFCEPQRWSEAEHRLLTQTMERYCVHKNIEWLHTFNIVQNEEEKLTFIPVMLRELDDDDFEFVAERYRSAFTHEWASAVISIPDDEVDWVAKLTYEYEEFIALHEYAKQTKIAWRQLCELIVGPIADKSWKQCLKTDRKGRTNYAAM